MYICLQALYSLTTTVLKMYSSLFTPLFHAADCGNPFKPDNGQVTFNKTLSGSEASYSCDHGYRLDGNAVISCQENSSWPQSPVCLSE